MKLPIAIILAAVLIAGAVLYVNREPEPEFQTPVVEPYVPFWEDPEYQQDELERRVQQLERECLERNSYNPAYC